MMHCSKSSNEAHKELLPRNPYITAAQRKDNWELLDWHQRLCAEHRKDDGRENGSR